MDTPLNFHTGKNITINFDLGGQFRPTSETSNRETSLRLMGCTFDGLFHNPSG
jgi:hypothetical protein